MNFSSEETPTSVPITLLEPNCGVVALANPNNFVFLSRKRQAHSCVRSTIILAPIPAIGHSSGANGSTPVRTECATDGRRSGELNHYTFAKTLRRARYVRGRTPTRCRTALWTPFRSHSRLPTHNLRRDISRQNSGSLVHVASAKIRNPKSRNWLSLRRIYASSSGRTLVEPVMSRSLSTS